MFGIKPKDDMERQIEAAKKHRQEYDELYYSHHENPNDYNTDDTDDIDIQDTDSDEYEPSEEYIRQRRIIRILMIIMILSVTSGFVIKHHINSKKYDAIAVPNTNSESESDNTDTTIDAGTINTDIKNNEELDDEESYDKEKYPYIVTDTMRYNNLTPGETYKLSYRIFDYDKETQETISERVAIAEFTPKESDGTIRIAIPCTLSEYESIIDDSQDVSIKYYLKTDTED